MLAVGRTPPPALGSLAADQMPGACCQAGSLPVAVLPGAAAQRASAPRFEPLWNRRLAGIWEGRKGVDLNPKAMGPERKEFIERIDLQPIDYQLNGPQLFYGLRYHTHILAVGEDATFHDQVGYWLWEPATAW